MSDGDGFAMIMVVSSGIRVVGAGDDGNGERQQGLGAEFVGAGECEFAL